MDTHQPIASPAVTAPEADLKAYQSTLSGTAQKVLQLLGKNLPASQVAATLGISESLVSQYLADERFKLLVQELRFKSAERVSKIDELYDEIEYANAKKLQKLAATTYSLKESLRIAQVINSAKRRGPTSQDTMPTGQHIVQITLPEILHRKFVKDTNNQVLEVSTDDGKSVPLITIKPGELQKIADSTEEENLLDLPEYELQKRYKDARDAKVKRLTDANTKSAGKRQGTSSEDITADSL